jgi:phosphoribosylformylglycinamidine synthase
LIRNKSLQFRCEPVFLKTATLNSPFTNQTPEDKLLCVPVAHGEGCYFADAAALAKLKANDQILWQYADANGELTADANPNGSVENIAGICNESRNVAGLMPHPERASEALMGGLADGKIVFDSLIAAFEKRGAQAAAA